ncbi:MAG: hypothetical protein FJ249_09195 [Nitrospira sp.]|nr:hypothetical protein [Nitrospira sp.]
MPTPEDEAREKIDATLDDSGWAVQDAKAANLSERRGVALRNFPLAQGHGFSEDQFKTIDDLDNAVEANLTRADRLRQSILSQAFSGRLVVDSLRGQSV